MKEQIVCRDRYGINHLVLPEKLEFRIGVSAVLQNNHRVFLFKDTSTNQLELPGGAVEIGESIEDALIRECREETGLLIQIGSLLTYRESLFYIPSKKKGYQNIRLFFSANQLTENRRPQKKQIGDYYTFDYLTASNTNEVTYSVLKEIFASRDT